MKSSLSETSGGSHLRTLWRIFSAPLFPFPLSLLRFSASVVGRETVLDTRDLNIVMLAPDWRTHVLSIISDPSIALILMTIGIYGLILEFMNSRMYLPGAAGAISLIIAFFALAILPATSAGLGLLQLGAALMIAEAA